MMARLQGSSSSLYLSLLIILSACSGSGGSRAVVATSGSGYAITGTIAPAVLGAGAVIAVSGTTSATTTASSSGTFRFSDLANGSYTVSAAKSGVAFSPAARTVVVNGTDVDGVNFTPFSGETNLIIDGSRSFQTMDGMGVNINVESWRGGELRPAMDLLVDQNGSWLFRVIRDPMDWVATESLLPALHALESGTLRTVYETPAMQDLWNTIGYLNGKGVGGERVIVHFMGWTPTWLGGGGGFGRTSRITAGKEGELATMIASLVYYGRKVRGLDFNLLTPLNESDWNCLEGPCVGSAQYAVFMRELADELDLMGLGDIRFVGPDTAGDPVPYGTAMLADSTVAARVAHIGSHSYETPAVPPPIASDKNFWLTERAAWCPTCDAVATAADEWGFARESSDYFLEDLGKGFSALLVYDGYDSFYHHHGGFSYWGLLAYDRGTGLYSPRKRFYTSTQLNRFILPGSERILTDSTTDGLVVQSFYHRASGRLTVVGHNTKSSDITLFGRLLNLSGAAAFTLHETNTILNMQKILEVPILEGGFAISIPPDTIFSLSN